MINHAWDFHENWFHDSRKTMRRTLRACAFRVIIRRSQKTTAILTFFIFVTLIVVHTIYSKDLTPVPVCPDEVKVLTVDQLHSPGSTENVRWRAEPRWPILYKETREEICINTSMLLLIYVHSKPDHFERRTAIRTTWGDTTLLRLFAAKMVFVLGEHGVYFDRNRLVSNYQSSADQRQTGKRATKELKK